MFEHEKECLKLISSGDKTAYKELFDYYYPKTLVFLTKLLSSEPEAETEASDLAEDIFVRVWLMRGIIPEINSFSGYLYRMTRNAAFTYLKKKRADVSLEDIDIAEEAAIEEACEAKEKQMQINRIVEKMPRQRKKVYVLSRIDGLSTKEIAARLGIAPKTVENHLNLALRDIRQALSVFFFFI